MDPHVPESEGAQPWAVASGLSGEAQCPRKHTHCPPISHWLVSKARENDYSHVFTETAVRGRQEFTAASNTCWLSYPNAVVLPCETD